MTENVFSFDLERGKPKPFLRPWLMSVFAGLKDGRYRLVITDEEEGRSAAQNRAFHKMVEPWLKEGHTLPDLKRDVLRAIFGEKEVVNAITGEVYVTLCEPHTSRLSKRNFSLLMQETARLAAECGVLLELPDEFKERKRKEAKQKGRAA